MSGIRLGSTWIVLVSAGSVLGCSHQQAKAPATAQAVEAPESGATSGAGPTDAQLARAVTAIPQPDATAEFVAGPGVVLSGEAQLKQTANGVRVAVEVDRGPGGEKGIHIHQKGDCSDIPGKSMGEHFAPEGHPHGLPTYPEHHLGDLGNIDITPAGVGALEIVVPGANLQPGDADSLLGKAIVIHETNDKGTGTSGDAGKPIACAVITPE
jgi:Cu-Zn family superoxide dismutase